MKILVMSDSHGSKNNILDAVEIESPDHILHCGDNNRDCDVIVSMYPGIPLRSVKGNCDRHAAGMDMDEFILGEKRFFMTHGHLFGVKTGRTSIINTAVNRGVDILLFGHTHIPHYSIIDDLIVINPGSIGAGGKSYAVLEIKNGEVKCDHKNL